MVSFGALLKKPIEKYTTSSNPYNYYNFTTILQNYDKKDVLKLYSCCSCKVVVVVSFLNSVKYLKRSLLWTKIKQKNGKHCKVAKAVV